MNISTSLRSKAGRTVVCGAVLAGFAGAALAGAGVAAADPIGHQLVQVTNYTPYTWTNITTIYEAGGPGELAPPMQVAPGQTASWDADPDLYGIETWNFVYDAPEAVYPANKEAVRVVSNGAVQAWAGVAHHPGKYKVPEIAHVADDPDGVANHFDVLWNKPTTIKIDNTVDPTAAANVMNHQFPRAVADSVKWTPNPGAEPTLTETDLARRSSTLENDSSAPAKILVDKETSRSQSTNLGVEVTGSISVKAFEVEAKVAASVTGEHSWGTSDSVEFDAGYYVKPHSIGWLAEGTNIVSLMGDMVFTSPEGITFDISNVSVSQSNFANPGGKYPSGMTITGQQCLLGSAACTTDAGNTGQ